MNRELIKIFGIGILTFIIVCILIFFISCLYTSSKDNETFEEIHPEYKELREKHSNRIYIPIRIR